MAKSKKGNDKARSRQDRSLALRRARSGMAQLLSGIVASREIVERALYGVDRAAARAVLMARLRQGGLQLLQAPFYLDILSVLGLEAAVPELVAVVLDPTVPLSARATAHELLAEGTDLSATLRPALAKASAADIHEALVVRVAADFLSAAAGHEAANRLQPVLAASTASLGPALVEEVRLRLGLVASHAYRFALSAGFPAPARPMVLAALEAEASTGAAWLLEQLAARETDAAARADLTAARERLLAAAAERPYPEGAARVCPATSDGVFTLLAAYSPAASGPGTALVLDMASNLRVYGGETLASADWQKVDLGADELVAIDLPTAAALLLDALRGVPFDAPAYLDPAVRAVLALPPRPAPLPAVDAPAPSDAEVAALTTHPLFIVEGLLPDAFPDELLAAVPDLDEATFVDTALALALEASWPAGLLAALRHDARYFTWLGEITLAQTAAGLHTALSASGPDHPFTRAFLGKTYRRLRETLVIEPAPAE